MKSGITRKLILYFSLVIVVFAIIISLTFSLVYSNNNKTNLKGDLLHQAQMIVDVIETNGNLTISDSQLNEVLQMPDLKDIQVWLVSKSGTIFRLTENQMGMGMMKNMFNLTASTRELLQKVLDGQQLSTDRVRGLFNTDTLTIGTPIYEGTNVIGALFISTSNSSVNQISRQGLNIFWISTLFGLIFASILGYYLSLHFVKPLNKANSAINTLAGGDYTVNLSSSSKDELGLLSSNINTLAQRLESAKESSDNLEKMRQNFISDITHELRTPVTVIRGLAEGIQDDIGNPKDSAHQIIEESESMKRLILDLLELSKLQDPDFIIEKRVIELHDLLSDISRSVQPLLLKKNMRLISSITEDQMNVSADYQRLRQLIFIIVDNAIKFSIDNSEITLNASIIKNKIELKISDSGIGMSDNQKKELFNRYSKDLSHSKEGSGLGLTIAHKIALRHNIEIKVDSTLDLGTSFILSIPLLSNQN
ncbi:MAG: HAMP domain-containing sensor histidine kinase [Erysipelotrichaceae bacterium]